MRVLVCGGRDFNDPTLLNNALDQLHKQHGFTTLVHGDARGADRLAHQWATNNNVTPEPHPADWKKHGKAAGPIRNREMLDTKPDLVVAFPGGKGTRDMTRQAANAGVQVINVMETT